MTQAAFLAHVIGIPNIPSIRAVNIRSGPGVDFVLLFKVPVGTDQLPIIDVQPDATGRQQLGKTYTWFRVQFPQGVGWVRDDLIEISGDGAQFGYPAIAFPVKAFNLIREITTSTPATQSGTSVASGSFGNGTSSNNQRVTPGSTTTAQPTLQPEPTADPDPILQPAEGGATRVILGVEPTPATEPVAQPNVTDGPPTAICMGKGGANIRSGPGVNNNPLGRMRFRDTAELLDGAPGEDGKDFQWANINFQGMNGWIREDLVRLQGNFGSIGLDHEDQFPCPLPDGWWIRDYDGDGSRIGTIHHGWDHGGDEGMAIFSGPVPASVVRVEVCQQCGPTGLSVLDKGNRLNDSRILRNPAWNFGYGHYVIVRYLNASLPTSTRRILTERGFEGQHIFVMYAHLLDMLVQPGQNIGATTKIGTCGDSGNSSGPHLHLELRAHVDANETNWSRMRAGLMSPDVLFLR